MKHLFNWVITLVFWGISGIFLVSAVSGMNIFNEMDPVLFSNYARILYGTIALLCGAFTTLWFIYSDNPKSTKDMKKTKSIWTKYFVFSIIINIFLVLVSAVILRNERPSVVSYLVIFGAGSLVTWINYWLVSFLFSPINTKYCVLGRK